MSSKKNLSTSPAKAMANARWQPDHAQAAHISQQARLLAFRRWGIPSPADAHASRVVSPQSEHSSHELAWLPLAGGMLSLLWGIGHAHEPVKPSPATHPILGDTERNAGIQSASSGFSGMGIFAMVAGIALILLAIHLFTSQS